jgi:DNA helicase-2/ATP-dependent DNA helicase PcrA
MALGIPYRVYGGLRFFERAEVKDALAYLRLVAHRGNDPSFERIINTPVRGIGAKALDLIRDTARQETTCLWEATERLCADPGLSGRTRTPLVGFVGLIHALADEIAELPLWEQVQRVIARSGLLDHYRKEQGEQAEARLENLDELINAARQFDAEPPDEELSRLDQFLAHASLEAGENQADAFQDCVQLMTLHAAKGLEFDLVFLVGMEEGLFPSLQSLEETGRLEEERRLCYVGITRARKKLYLTHAECRRLYGKETYPRPSRFIREIPSEQLEEIRLRGAIARPSTHVPVTRSTGVENDSGLRLGQRVHHAKFGEGVILQQEGAGAQARVQVNFAEAGAKWLMLAYAKLQPL